MQLLRSNPALRAILASRLISTVGTWLAYIALVAEIYARTRSSGWVAALLVVEFVPSLLVACLGGAIDRLPRKLLLIGAEAGGCVVFALLPLATTPLAIVALAAAAGLCGAVFTPALMAAIPNLVSAEDLPAATGLNQTMSTAGLAAGPALGGVVVAALGVDAAFGFNALSFAFSALVLTRVPRTSLQRPAAFVPGLWHGAAVGLRLVRSTQLLRTIFWTSGVAVLAVSVVNVGEVFLARGTFGAGSLGFGVLASGIGAGLVAGSAWSARVVAALGGLPTYRAGLLVAAIGLGAAALSPDVWVAAACAGVGGVGNALFLAGRANALQTTIDDSVRGSAFALLYGIGDVGMSAGMIGAGLTIGLVGARAIWLLGALAFVAAFLGVRSPRTDAIPVAAST